MKTLAKLPLTAEIVHNYFIQQEPGDILILRVGCTNDHASSHFESDKLLAKSPEVLEFKTYLPGGGKRWNSKAGCELFFAVPKSALLVCEEEGYSYPKVLIAGEKFSLNVSGGSYPGKPSAWLDYIRNTASTNCNLPNKTLKAIASAALSPDEAIARGVRVEPWQDDPRYTSEHAAFYAAAHVRSQAIEKGLLTPGAKVHLREGYRAGNSDTLTIAEADTRRRHVLCSGSGPYSPLWRVPFVQIDWQKTAGLNTWPITAPKYERVRAFPPPALEVKAEETQAQAPEIAASV